MKMKSVICSLLLASSICSGLELAEKHLADLKKLCDAGMECPIKALLGEADLIRTKLFLEPFSAEQMQQAERMKALYQQACQLAESRYKMGICSYLDVYKAKEKLLFAEGGCLHDDWEQLNQDLVRYMESADKAGVADSLENAKMQRLLLNIKFFSLETSAANRAELRQQIEQNFDDAEKLAFARYIEGLAPAGIVEEIQFERDLFEYKTYVMQVVYSESVMFDASAKKLKKKFAALAREIYNKVASRPNVSPAILLAARLNYLLANKMESTSPQ